MVRAGDRVLVVHLDNPDDPVICGVIDGLRRREDPAPTAAARLSIGDDESVLAESEDGGPLLEIHRSEAGPVVRLRDEDALLSVGPYGPLPSTSRPRTGRLRIRAAEDVVVQDEIVRLN